MVFELDSVLAERLRQHAHNTRRTKLDVVSVALEAYLPTYLTATAPKPSHSEVNVTSGEGKQ